MTRRRLASSIVGMAAFAAASPSFANGRFPRAERLIEDPRDPNHLLIAGTYGILATRDRGGSWYHVCEASFSLQDAYLGDPLLDLMSDGSMLVGVQTTLNASYDGGCQWATVLGSESVNVFDDAISRSDPSIVVALVGIYEGGGISYAVQRSTDYGKTWGPPGPNLPVDSAYTIDVDPHDPSRLYLTGLVANEGRFAVSSDAGATWTTYPISGTSVDNPPYLAGVHPLDSNRIFVRTDAWMLDDGALTANDALLYSGDGGQTWMEAFRSRAKLFGFTLSPDGSTVLIGYGDPRDGAGQAVPGPFGVYASPTDVLSFQPIYSGYAGCLAWTSTGVYVCGSQAYDGFELAFAPSADLGPDAGNLAPLLSLERVRGPLACDAGTRGVLCVAAWDVACATFGACDAGPTDAGPIADARSGTTEAGADTGTSAGGEVASQGAACGCRVPGRTSSRGAGVLALFGWLSFHWRKRSTSARRNPPGWRRR
jgi:photosystem II stability/assembly factor-like uncharacterized protein